MTDGPILKISNLSHRYAKEWALKQINMDAPPSGILGLLGANGAGKSTLMNIMCGVLFQTQGKVIIDGLDVRRYPLEAKRRIGFLPQQAPVHLELTVDEYLTYCAHLRLMEPAGIAAALEAVKSKCGLSHFSRRIIQNLSGGYRQRVGIAQAIIHDPNVVVLDEPTNGLDPNQIQSVRQLIADIAESRFVILSSHILSEVVAVCSNIVMIDKGEIVFSGTMNEFNELTPPSSLLVTFNRPPKEDALASIAAVTTVEKMAGGRFRLSFVGGRSVSEELVALSVREGWALSELQFERDSLERTFAKLSVERVEH